MKGQELTVYKKDTWHLQEGLRQIRESMVHSVQEAAPDQAGILCAMTAGEKSLLGQEEKNLLSAGAVSHMVSISGMHVSLLGMMVFYGLLRLGAGLLPSSGVSAGMMILYGMMTGESVSAMRALGMFGLAVAAKAVGWTRLRLIIRTTMRERIRFLIFFIVHSFLCIIGRKGIR